METILKAFLETNKREAWTPGEKVDCCLVLAEWLMWLGYPDPATHLRGSYQAGQGQIDTLANGRGAVGLIEDCIRPLALDRVKVPRLGDIGAVGSPHKLTRQFGVIHDGAGWLTRTPNGFVRLSAPTLAIWRP